MIGISKADNIFIAMCRDILNNGVSSEGQIVRAKWKDGTPAHTIKRFGVVNRYNLAEEFPIMTLRPTNLKAAIDELLWIWQKKSNNVNQLNIRHKYPEGWKDQVDRVLYDLKYNPYSRRIIVNMYNHADLHMMNLYPCAYSVTFNVTGKKLNAILNQRSQDVLVANNWNVSQYAILVHMFAQVSGFEVGELVHVIADAHIYDRHIPLVKELINRENFDSPRLTINPDVKDFYKFTVDDFILVDYKSGTQIKNIPVAV